MGSTTIKPRLIYTLLCDDVRQEMGGKFSLMGLFESISSHSFPALHHRFAIINEWLGGKGEFIVKIRLLSPDKTQVISESEMKLTLFNETQRHRDISIRHNTTFKVPGTYWIETLLDGERVGIVPIVLQTVNDQMIH
jgi:Family of unknown function (DUF6941)